MKYISGDGSRSGNKMKQTVYNYLYVLICFFCAYQASYAQENFSEEQLRSEVYYISNLLLEMHKKDNYTLEAPAYDRPFLGLCPKADSKGILLTCITPDGSAEKSKLKIDDIIVEIDGEDFLNDDKVVDLRIFGMAITKLKIGEKYLFKILRDDKEIDVEVSVGSIRFPGFKLEINKKPK